MKKIKGLLRLLCITLLTSLFWVGIAQLDPFGAKTASALHSESIFCQLIGGPWYHSYAQDKITVVLIDDKYVRDRNDSWPLSYQEQGFLLDDLLEYKPRLIFLDFLYEHQHGSDEDLQQYIQIIEQTDKKQYPGKEVPIFIPYLMDPSGDLNSCDSVVADDYCNCRESNRIIPLVENIQNSIFIKKTYIGWQGCDNKYPSYISGDKKYKTPAYAIYEHLCGKTSRNSHFPSIHCDISCDDFYDPMIIRWGTSVSRNQNCLFKKHGHNCTYFSQDKWQGLLDKTSYFFSQLMLLSQQSLRLNPERGSVESCPYTDTVYASWLNDISPEIRKKVKRLLKNRIILVGTDINGVHDRITNPINKTLPGIYLISMALDNYMTYGKEYYKSMDRWEFLLLEILFLWGMTFSLSLVKDKTLTKFQNNDYSQCLVQKYSKIISIVIVYKMILPVMLSLVVVFVLWYLRFSPMDWIGISVLSFVNNPIKIRDYVNSVK